MTRYQLWIEKTAVWKALLSAERIILIATGAFSALLVTFNVLCRYIFKVDVFANEEIITLVTLWMYFIGAGYCSATEGHIKADLIAPAIKSGRGKKIVKIFVNAVTVIVEGFFTCYGYNYLLWCIGRNGRTPGLGIPMVASQMTLFIGIALMFIYTLVRLAGYIMTPEEDFLVEAEDMPVTVELMDEDEISAIATEIKGEENK